MLCRTGLVWKSTIDDQVLTFRLIGVNNQNFIMEDEQTGTWWQQVTGEAITGPLVGKRLELMFSPARWTTASTPSRARGSIAPVTASQRISA